MGCARFPELNPNVFMYIKVERIKERVEEKEGIPPQQQRLIYSGKQMWVSIMSRFPLQHLQCPIYHLPFDSWSCASQEWWEDRCRLQDPGRISASSCAGPKRRLGPPGVQFTSLLPVMSRCCCTGPAECQCFRPLSQPNHNTDNRRSWAEATNTHDKGRFHWSIDIFPPWPEPSFKLKHPCTSQPCGHFACE